jgi:hypothetical protein
MSIRTAALACAMTFAAAASFAQQAPVPAAAASAAAPDCAMQRHDHGAERGTPSAQKGCKPAKQGRQEEGEDPEPRPRQDAQDAVSRACSRAAPAAKRVCRDGRRWRPSSFQPLL